MNQELMVLVEQAAQARGERPLVPRSFIAMALEKIENNDEEVEKYPTGAPSLRGVYEIAVKLFNARCTNCGGDGRIFIVDRVVQGQDYGPETEGTLRSLPAMRWKWCFFTEKRRSEMPFVNKEMQLTDFLEQLHKRIEASDNSAALIFFEVFLQKRLVEAVKKHPGLASDWDGRVNAGDFDVIYPMAAEILHDAASREYSSTHPDIYKDAHAVSTAFCEELNKFFECSGDEGFDLIPIKSFVDMAVEAGTVVVEDGFVKLTPEGEEIAQSVERQIKGEQN